MATYPDLVGDNRHSPADDARAAMLDVLAQRKARIEEFVANLGKRTIVCDRQDASDATDVIGLAQKVLAAIEVQRKEISAPYDEAAKVPLAVMRNGIEPLQAEIDRVVALVDAFDAAEKARIDSQRAEQAQVEARLRAAAEPNKPRADIVYADGGPAPTAPPTPAAPKAAPIRGDYGFTYRKRDRIAVEVTDASLVPADILDTDAVKEAIAKVVKKRASESRSYTCPGTIIHRGTRGSVN